MASLDIIKEETGKILADLHRKYVAVCVQLKSTQNAADRISLKTQISEFEKEIRETEEKLTLLESCDTSLQQHHSEICKFLHKIDFQEPMDIVKDTLRKFGREGGAALFLLQNSYPMAGECCIAQMRDLLEEETHPGNFHNYAISFSVDTQPNELGLFHRLGGYCWYPTKFNGFGTIRPDDH